MMAEEFGEVDGTSPKPGEQTLSSPDPFLMGLVLNFLTRFGYGKTLDALRVDFRAAQRDSNNDTAVVGVDGNVNGAPEPNETPNMQDEDFFNSMCDYFIKNNLIETFGCFHREHAEIQENAIKYQLLVEGMTELINVFESGLIMRLPYLQRLKFPIFVHIYLDMVRYGQQAAALKFWRNNSKPHKYAHHNILDNIYNVIKPHHLDENTVSKLFYEMKYRVRVHNSTQSFLFDFFLDSEELVGTALAIAGYINSHVDLVLIPGITTIFDRGDELMEDEGIARIASN